MESAVAKSVLIGHLKIPAKPKLELLKTFPFLLTRNPLNYMIPLSCAHCTRIQRTTAPILTEPNYHAACQPHFQGYTSRTSTGPGDLLCASTKVESMTPRAARSPWPPAGSQTSLFGPLLMAIGRSSDGKDNDYSAQVSGAIRRSPPRGHGLGRRTACPAQGGNCAGLYLDRSRRA